MTVLPLEDRIPRPKRHLVGSWVLVFELVGRGTSFYFRPPAQDILAELSGWVPYACIVAAVCIGVSAVRLPNRLQNVAGLLGHMIGLLTIFVYIMSIAIGAVALGSSWFTLGAYVFVLLAHLVRLRGHGLDLQEGGLQHVLGRRSDRSNHHRRGRRFRGDHRSHRTAQAVHGS